MRRVYVSPHLDDAVFSCGGLIARQAARGDRVEIVTIFGGESQGVLGDQGGVTVNPPTSPRSPCDIETPTPPSTPCDLDGEDLGSPLARGLVSLWGAPPDILAARQEEDRLACARLGATPRHLPFAEAIFRCHGARLPAPGGRQPALDGPQPCYPTAAHLFGEPHESDRDLVDRVAAELVIALAGAGEIYCPAAIGRHVDHRLARLAAERAGVPLTYYEEQPYAARGYLHGAPLPPRAPERIRFEAAELDVWADAAWEYRIGAKTFWRSRDELRVELGVTQDRAGGFALWSADASTCSYTAR